MYRHFFFITCFLFSTPSFAVEAIQFSVTPDKSTLRFEATQNGAVVSGTFTHFNADIAFHPENLSESAVTVVIDTQNIAMSYAEAANTLPEEEWFNSESFPSATLKTQSFTKIDETHFTADAILTIKRI